MHSSFKYHLKYQIIFISIYLSFPVFCVIFPDFSSLFKIPQLFLDWKMPYHFYSPSGNPVYCVKATAS